MANPLLIAKPEQELSLLPRMSNRHGLIAGATGTGKTVRCKRWPKPSAVSAFPSLQADVKRDLSGISQPAVNSPELADRVKKLGCPVTCWDVFGEQQRHPVRATVSEMGRLLFSRLFESE